MEEVLSLFWKWNFPIGMLLFQTVMCISYGRRKYFILKWMAFTAILFLVAITMTYEWKWDGSRIDGLNILSNMPARIMIMAIIAFQMFICYKISFWTSLFFTTLSITLHNIHFSLYKIIEALTIGSVVNTKPGLMSFFIDVIVLMIFLVGVGYVFNKKDMVSIDDYRTGKKVLVISLIMLVITHFLILFQFANDPYSNFGITLVVGRLYDICFNIVTFYLIYNLVVKNNLEIEQQRMENLLRQRQNQFTLSQQLIDNLNIKSHDLKKQIHYLEKNEFSRNEMVQGLKDALMEFNTLIETKNEALSTILSEKSLVCHNNQIKFLCVANGENLDFIKPIDIYTIFANLLDNAIEASLQLEEDKRNITVIVKQKEDFVSVHIENYYTGKINLKDGTIQTMKPETELHGYGVKSIQKIVESYKGDIAIRTDRKIFSVNILIPISDEKRRGEKAC